MKPITERMVQVAAVVIVLWAGWNLVAGSVVQMVNLSMQAKALKQALGECQMKGQSKAP